jgi:hypothetical protein
VDGAYTHLFPNEESVFSSGTEPKRDFVFFDFFLKWDQKILKEKGRFYFSTQDTID